MLFVLILKLVVVELNVERNNMDKQVIHYHCTYTPPPKIEIGRPAHIFPSEMETTEDGRVQRKYGLTKTDIIIGHDVLTGNFYTKECKYVLRMPSV